MKRAGLKPCPFCGTPPGRTPYCERELPYDENSARAVVCENCLARGPLLMPGLDGAECNSDHLAKLAWNCRYK